VRRLFIRTMEMVWNFWHRNTKWYICDRCDEIVKIKKNGYVHVHQFVQMRPDGVYGCVVEGIRRG
jgi:ppGpp synthetase/RelA/SpoT-type nucleotidyltranferase